MFFFWRDDFHTALTLIYWLLVFRLIAVVYHRSQPQTFNLLLTFVPVSMKHFVFESFLFGTKMILSISEDDKNWIMSVKKCEFRRSWNYTKFFAVFKWCPHITPPFISYFKRIELIIYKNYAKNLIRTTLKYEIFSIFRLRLLCVFLRIKNIISGVISESLCYYEVFLVFLHFLFLSLRLDHTRNDVLWGMNHPFGIGVKWFYER